MPSDASPLYDAALELARRGRLEEADARLAELLGADPAHATGWGLRAALHMQRGRPRDALPAYDSAVSLGDDDPRTHLGRGLALLEFERHAEALESLSRAAALDPGLIRAHTGKSWALRALGRAAEALESADHALALDRTSVEAWRRRGLALFDLERMEEALSAFRAIPVSGSSIHRADLLADIGLALEGLRRDDEALAAYDEAVAIAPQAWQAPFRRGFLRLLHGDFAGGWADYESRWRGRQVPVTGAVAMTAAFRERLLTAPAAEDLAGQRVLVVAEQGVGDVMMFASLLPDLAAIAAQVTCVVEPRLLALFAHAFPDIAFVAGQGPGLVDLSRIDRLVAIGSLAHAFRRSAAAFPGRSYLRSSPSVAEAWRRRLGPCPARLRIGVSWRGGVARTRTGARSMPIETLRPLLARPDCEVFSLQYGRTDEEIAAMNTGLPRPIASFPPAEIDDFEQLAGLVSALDAVVTVQTAVAHLTGAVGKPGFVMIPERAEWRYGAQGPSMPWYASLRLFRQDEGGDWPGVVARVGAALDGLDPRATD